MKKALLILLLLRPIFLFSQQKDVMKKTIEELVVFHLAEQCKDRENAEERFGIHLEIKEDFGAIELAATSKFLSSRDTEKNFRYPRILCVNLEGQYVSEIDVQFIEIKDIKEELIRYTALHKLTIRDVNAYDQLIKLIKQHYPQHPIEKSPANDGIMKQTRINLPIKLLDLDSLDLLNLEDK